MDEGISANLAEARLKVSAAELQRFIELGHGNGRTRVKPGSAKVDIVAQGQTAWWSEATMRQRRDGAAAAFQFKCMFRQKDVIGEWLPVSEPGIADVTAWPRLLGRH